MWGWAYFATFLGRCVCVFFCVYVWVSYGGITVSFQDVCSIAIVKEAIEHFYGIHDLLPSFLFENFMSVELFYSGIGRN
jgi:hypothetical protein